MIIKNPARPFCHKYISLPFHNKTLRKKWIPASKSKMKSLRFSAAGRPPAGRRPKKENFKNRRRNRGC